MGSQRRSGKNRICVLYYSNDRTPDVFKTRTPDGGIPARPGQSKYSSVAECAQTPARTSGTLQIGRISNLRRETTMTLPWIAKRLVVADENGKQMVLTRKQ